MNEAAWARALDILEQRLRAQEAVAAGESGNVPVCDFDRPPGPLPMSMLVRARALLDRCRRVEALAATELARRRGAPTAYGDAGASLGSV